MTCHDSPCRRRHQSFGIQEISAYDVWIRTGHEGTKEDFLEWLKGEPGPPGKGFSPLGSYATLADLEAAITDPKPGDIYAVGAEPPYDFYFWDSVLSDWTDMGTIQGPKGDDGKGFAVLGHYDTLSELEDEVTDPEPGDGYSVGTTQPFNVYVWNPTAEEWQNVGPIQGPAGEDGKSVELRLYSGYIQWRPTDGSWANLVPLTDITGPSGDDGKSVELQVTSTHIQWRQEGGSWANLVALADITGPTGADGGYYSPFVNSAGVLSWTGSKAGMPAVSSANIKGPQGPEGPPGTGFLILGYYETLQDLEDATGILAPAQGDIYGVGAEEPYTFYAYDVSGQEWVSLGQIQGPAGADGTDGTDGADGGYYTPAVDASGNLTWTASQQGMTPVSSSNIKGPTGAAGPNQVTAATTTTLVGLLKAVGGLIAAAVEGTDYYGQASLGAAGKLASLNADSILTPSQALAPVVTITSNTTLGNAHKEAHLNCNNSSAITITIPADSSNNTFPINTVISFSRSGIGGVTISPAAGVYLRSNGARANSAKTITNTYNEAYIRKVTNTDWNIEGAVS